MDTLQRACLWICSPLTDSPGTWVPGESQAPEFSLSQRKFIGPKLPDLTLILSPSSPSPVAQQLETAWLTAGHHGLITSHLAKSLLLFLIPVRNPYSFMWAWALTAPAILSFHGINTFLLSLVFQRTIFFSATPPPPARKPWTFQLPHSPCASLNLVWRGNHNRNPQRTCLTYPTSL